MVSPSAVASLVAIGLIALASSAVDYWIRWRPFAFFRWGRVRKEVRGEFERDQTPNQPPPAAPPHPDAVIRLGHRRTGRGHVDLPLAALGQHVFLPGASGSGKTKTVTRLAQGALAAGWGLVIVDVKGGALRGDARRLAAEAGVPFQLVDPRDAESLGYNPAEGTGSEVANKLIGSFSYGPQAEIYQNIGQTIIPPIVDALRIVHDKTGGDRVTVRLIAEAMARGKLGQMAREPALPEPLRDTLTGITARRNQGGVAEDLGGLEWRLGALLHGHFGPLLDAKAFLSWDEALGRPSVTYLALAGMGASKDVELLGRVIAMDLKAAAYRRLDAVDRGQHVVPTLIVFDEFAALREAEQLVDLLLQGREARMPVVVSTQYLPESLPLRKATMGAGLIIAHRVESDDAEALAAQLGTRLAPQVTMQRDLVTGFSDKGSIRSGREFRVHPDRLRSYRVGEVAISQLGQPPIEAQVYLPWDV